MSEYQYYEFLAVLLHESVDIAGATGGRVAIQRIRDTRRDLTPWRTGDLLIGR